MAFDIEIIRGKYREIPERVAAARSVLKRPMTLLRKSCIRIWRKATPPWNTSVESHT